MPGEIEAYLSRISYSGPLEPTVDVLHAITQAHTQSIPFENLDVLLGRPIDLGIEAVFHKLVHQRRGGYCFEQNGLFLHVLEQLGFEAAAISARVRLQRSRDFTPARTHVFIRVEVDGESWLTDVGIGGVSLTSAIRLNTDREQSTPHEPRRIVREGGRLFHQIRFNDEWSDVCEFTLEEMPLIDREIANWYTSAHPQSPFRNRLIVARAAPGGVRVSLQDNELNIELNIRSADGRANRTQIRSASELLEILDSHFGLQFPAGTTFGVPGSGFGSPE